MPSDLDHKLTVLREQTRERMTLQEQRHEERKQEILLQNQLKANSQLTQTETSAEIIKLQHKLDVETRQRNRDDTVFYKNLDLQEFIKTQQLRQNHLLEEIHHTTVATIMEKAIIMILGAKLEEKGRAGTHSQTIEKKTHETNEQMRLEHFRADLAQKYGEEKAKDFLKIIEENIGEWEEEFKNKF